MVLKKSLSARRVPRVVGQEEDGDPITPDISEQGSSTTSSKGKFPFSSRLHHANSAAEDIPVIRPLVKKAKKRSALRLSFGPGEAAGKNEDSDSEDASIRRVVKPSAKKLGGSKSSIGRKLEPRNLPTSDDLPFRAGISEDRPSYSKAYLDELKHSTPSTPKKEISPAPPDSSETSKAIDIAAKFGNQGVDRPSYIPSEAEIREKKERRARLGKEREFISLEPNSDDEADQRQMSDEDSRELMRRTGVQMEDKYDNPESRLIRDNEDFAEGFEEYVEDDKMTLGRKAQREAAAKKRADMAAMINEAEGRSSNEASSDSELERNAAYEAVQARAGTYGMKNASSSSRNGQQNVKPVPELSAVTARINKTLEKLKEAQAMKVRRLESIRAEKKEIAEREVWIQAQLKETAERYEKLRAEAGLPSGALTPMNGDGPKLIMDRGLENMGATPTAGSSDEEEIGHPGLGA